MNKRTENIESMLIKTDTIITDVGWRMAICHDLNQMTDAQLVELLRFVLVTLAANMGTFTMTEEGLDHNLKRIIDLLGESLNAQ